MISVIIPSKLDRAPDGEFWFRKALKSIWACCADVQVILAVDNGVQVPLVGDENVIVSQGPYGKRSHVSAMNAAMSYVTGQYVAFLEDDDLWHPARLELGLTALTHGEADFVSCSQAEVKPTGEFVRVNDFPTCSGWLIRQPFLRDLGRFDERFKIHWDNEFLGRINKCVAPTRRIHLVETQAGPMRDWLRIVAQFARPMETGISEQLVTRVVHDDSIMGGMDAARRERSTKEYAALEILYGCIPW